MLTAHAPTADDHRLLAALAADLPSRRWFPAKGAAAQLAVHAVLDLDAAGGPGTAGGTSVRILLVAARAASGDTLLQVPVVVLDDGSALPDGARPLGDGRAVLDGAAHPAFLRAWFAHARGPAGAPGPVDLTRVRPITGEQSNSSAVLGDGPDRTILKVLRAVQPGENPDVEVPRRLVEHGWTGVPAPRAWLQATWPDLGGAAPGAPVTGYLGVASAFVAGARDGFELACDLAREGTSFAGPAARLGAVTASMHAALAQAFPTTVDAHGPDRLAAALLDRFAWASTAVPALEPYGPGVAAVAARVRGLPGTPPRQRVHGDLHLGQVLHVADDWLVLDFEGEPLAPLAARTRPDLAVRDVAGLLRSFDYAAAVGGLTGTAAHAWTTSARTAFTHAYDEAAGAAAGGAEHTLLVRALELDKALYEAVYEARNRPDWLPIPLAGLDRLVG